MERKSCRTVLWHQTPQPPGDSPAVPYVHRQGLEADDSKPYKTVPEAGVTEQDTHPTCRGQWGSAGSQLIPAKRLVKTPVDVCACVNMGSEVSQESRPLHGWIGIWCMVREFCESRVKSPCDLAVTAWACGIRNFVTQTEY